MRGDKVLCFQRLVYSISNWARWLSIGALVGMMLLVCLNVLLRLVCFPIKGTFEIVGFLAAILISCAIAHTQVKRGHIAIELVVSRLPPRMQIVIDIINWFLSLSIFSLVTWQLIAYDIDTWSVGQASILLKIPLPVVISVVAAAFLLFCLVLLLDLLRSLEAVRQ